MDGTRITSPLDGLVKAVTWPCLHGHKRVDDEIQPRGLQAEHWSSSNDHHRAKGLAAGRGRSDGKDGREWNGKLRDGNMGRERPKD